VIATHVPLEAELVEQRRMIGLALAHHSLGSRCQTTVPEAQRNSEFFNTIRSEAFRAIFRSIALGAIRP
jgi:hypothetical protein